jgi:DNA invertase Pin-like site-specific DNA recombinase
MRDWVRKDITKNDLFRSYVIDKKSVSDIAKEYNCSTSLINYRLKKYGIERHHKQKDVPKEIIGEMLAKGKTVSQIASELGIERTTLYSKIKKDGIEIPHKQTRRGQKLESQNKRIIEMHQNKTPVRDIAIAVGLSKSTVYKRLLGGMVF